MNVMLIAPELVLVVFASVLILLTSTGRRAGYMGGMAAAGLVAAAAVMLGTGGTGEAFSGAIVVDDFARVFKALFLGATLLVVLFSADYEHRLRGSASEYYGLLLLACAAMMLLASSGELITVYISLETTTIALAVLAGLLKDGRSTEAGIKFLLLGAMSSAVLLYGMAIFFGLTGTTNLQEIGAMLPGAWQGNRPAILLATVLLVAGFGFKLATVPFQMWVPDVYEGAPTPVTAFFSVVSKAGGVAIVLRVFHSALGQEPVSGDWPAIFAILSALSMTLGNIVALQQRNIKRMMGYSSIAHAGYLLVGLAVAPQLGVGAVVFYLLSYAFTNLGAFAAITVLSERVRSDNIADYTGMWQRSPYASIALAFCLLSLTGIPPTSGFFAKLFIFNAGVQQGLGWLVLIGVLTSVLSAYYYLGVLRTVFLGDPATALPLTPSHEGREGTALPLPPSHEGREETALPLAPSHEGEGGWFRPSRAAMVAIGIGVLGTLLLGVFPGPALDAAAVASASIRP